MPELVAVAGDPSLHAAPGRISFKKLAVLVGIGLVLGAIPFAGGVICLILAGSLRGTMKRDRRRLIDYDPDDPVTSVADAEVGRVVRVVGKVEPVALIQAPVSDVKVAFASLIVHRRTTGRYASVDYAFTEDYGETITLRDATGSALVPTKGMKLVAKHVSEGDHHGALTPGVIRDAVSKHMPRIVDDSLTLELVEHAVQVGDELSVTARVEQSDQVPASAERGYRQGGAEQRIVMGPRGDGNLLASTYDLEDIAALQRKVATYRIAVPLLAFIGVVAWAAWLVGIFMANM